MLVTFDFDATLTKPVKESFAWQDTSFWETSTKPREDVLELLRSFSEQGHEVRVVTTRDHVNSEEVFEFIKEHSLPVREVHFTNGDDKLPTLEELGSDLHFDDSLSELERLREAEIDHRLVVHPADKERHSDKIEQFETV